VSKTKNQISKTLKINQLNFPAAQKSLNRQFQSRPVTQIKNKLATSFPTNCKKPSFRVIRLAVGVVHRVMQPGGGPSNAGGLRF